jgi:N6-adenosine-specific RNA methylase IME4/ParB-like chromosome segregation protein Spo0J
MSIMTLEFHPLANIFPLLEGEPFNEVVADIRTHGLRESIVLLEGKILDGRNRYRACLIARCAPIFVDYLGDDPLGFVISKNLHRRHLTESQRAMVAANIATMRQGRPGKHANLHVFSRERAAELLNVSERSVASAHAVHERGTPELVQAVERGNVSVSTAADVAMLSVEEQRMILGAVDKREILEAARKIRAVKSAENWARWSERAIELSKTTSPLPQDRRYPIIYADPPWEFHVYDRDSGSTRCPDAHYPTMSTEDICEMPVGDLATPDAALFLWTTAPTFPESLRVLDAWGFEYVTHLVWVKNTPGLGYWVRNQHETLIIATRGNMRSPQPAARPASIVQAPKREHSQKPDEVYDIIERMYPELPRIELFARNARKGWSAWGNQAP